MKKKMVHFFKKFKIHMFFVPLSVILMFFIVFGVNVKANSYFDSYKVNVYETYSRTNPDTISFELFPKNADSENVEFLDQAGFVVSGIDSYFYTDSTILINDDYSDGWVIGNDVYGESTLMRGFTSSTLLQNNRLRISKIVRASSLPYVSGFKDDVFISKSNFFLMKKDFATISNENDYGLFPRIVCYASDTIIDANIKQTVTARLFCEFMFVNSNGEFETKAISEVLPVSINNYGGQIYFSSNALGLVDYPDTTIIYIKDFSLSFHSTNSAEGYAIRAFTYDYCLLSNEDKSSYDLRYDTIAEDFFDNISGSGTVSIDYDFGSWLLNSANSFFSFEIFPGFSLFHLISLLIAIPLLIWVLKLILGG